MSDTRRSLRSRGWVGGFVLALVASVLPIAQQIGSVDAAAPGQWEAVAVDPAMLTPIADGTITLESDGTTSGPAFRYSYSRPGGGVPDSHRIKINGVRPHFWHLP